MLKKLLIPLLAAAALGGGGGYFVKSSGLVAAGSPEDGDHSEASSAAAADHAVDGLGGEAKSVSKSGGHEKPAAMAVLKFSRQFVVPVIKDGKPLYLMIFDINIVLDDTKAEGAYTYEPQLRDAMLSDLLKMASEDILIAAPQDAAAMAVVKQRLLAVSRQILGESAVDILLLDFGLQPY